MAANVVKGGHEVLVHDADTIRAAAVAAEIGAKAVVRPAELADAAVIVTMLPDGKAVQSVALGEDGIVRAARPGTLVIDMSSSQPLITRETGVALAAQGITLIDAPVSGGVQRAITGTLTIMIGSDDAGGIEKAKPILACMGNAFFVVGKLGAGHAAKALNNVVGASNYAVLAEALLIAERYGIDPATLVDIINVSTGQSFASSVVMKQFVIPGTYATGFKVGLLAKDVGIAADLGTQLGCDAPFIDLAQQRWAEARDILGAEEDNCRAILAWRKDTAL
jgi:3-hydroxyisobutyrate dehydrogenase